MAAKPRAKRYTDPDGMYLAIDDRAEGMFIGWFDQNESDFGAYVGEEEHHGRLLL